MFTQKFLRTSDSWSLLIVRVTVGGVILVHGLQKLGVIGDGNWSGTMGFLTGMGIPSIVAALVILGESVGAASLILGFLSRFCALGIGIIMLGAIMLVHAKNGFSAGNGGYEMHLLIIGMCAAIAVAGGGKWSVDRVIVK
ncbi:MAG: putative oxidoreductase [Candidatus Peregrinibacteria bacterium Greene1014_49]|nr:MAG: putative oxidoreductase [Candidatus Peregrinibacteria bacterium Greene1014_49]